MAVQLEINGPPAGSKDITHIGALPQDIPLNETGGTGAAWAWTLLDAPAGSTAFIDFPAIQAPTLRGVDLEGSYLLRVVVDGAEIDQAVAYVNDMLVEQRVPAAGETDEVDATDGWAADRNRFLHLVATEFGRGRGVQTVRLTGIAGGFDEGDIVNISCSKAPAYTLENGLNIPLAEAITTGTGDGVWGLVLSDMAGGTTGIANAADETARVLIFGLQEFTTLAGAYTTGNSLYIPASGAAAGSPPIEIGSMWDGTGYNDIDFQEIGRVVDGTTGLIELYLSERNFRKDCQIPSFGDRIRILGPDIVTGTITIGLGVNATGGGDIRIGNVNVLGGTLKPGGETYGSCVSLRPEFNTYTRITLAREDLYVGGRAGVVASPVLAGTGPSGEEFQVVCVDGYVPNVTTPPLPAGVVAGTVLCLPGTGGVAGEFGVVPSGTAPHGITTRTVPVGVLYLDGHVTWGDTIRVSGFGAIEQIPSWRCISGDAAATAQPRYAGDQLSLVSGTNVEIIPDGAAAPRTLTYRKHTHHSLFLNAQQAAVDYDDFVVTMPSLVAPIGPAHNVEWVAVTGGGTPDATYWSFPFTANAGNGRARALITWDFAFVNRRYDPTTASKLKAGDVALLWLEAGKVSNIRFDLIFYNNESAPAAAWAFSALPIAAAGNIFGSYGLWARTWEDVGVPGPGGPAAHAWKVESRFLGNAGLDWAGAKANAAYHPYNAYPGNAVILDHGITRQGILDFDPRSPTDGSFDLYDIVNNDPAFYYTFALQIMADDCVGAPLHDLGVIGLEISAIMGD